MQIVIILIISISRDRLIRRERNVSRYPVRITKFQSTKPLFLQKRLVVQIPTGTNRPERSVTVIGTELRRTGTPDRSINEILVMQNKIEISEEPSSCCQLLAPPGVRILLISTGILRRMQLRFQKSGTGKTLGLTVIFVGECNLNCVSKKIND